MKRSGAYKLYVGHFIYIGSSNNVDYRRAHHVTLLRKGEHPNPKLQFAWDQDAENVKVTVLRPLKRKEGESDTQFRNRLRDAEQELLNHFSVDPRLTNISLNARGPDKRADMKAKWRDPEFRGKMMTMLRGRGAPSKETRARMSEAKKGLLNPGGRPVQVVWPDGREECFPTGSAAAKELKVNQQLVSMWLNGKSPMPGKGKHCRKYWLEGVVVSYAD